MLKICILGYGGIARAHKAGYNQELFEKGIARLVAVCDINPEKFTEKVSTNLGEDKNSTELDFNTYTDLDEMLSTEQPDIVTVALPTYLHKEKTVYLLKKGYNVFCEKPMALTYDDCREMLDAAAESGKQLMIGQCLHFFPAYEYLKEVVEDKRFGAVRSGFFHRLSVPPVWGFENWFMDTKRSGGCIQDLHIHDIDFIRYAFGDPKKASCLSKKGFTDYESANTTLWYDGFTVTAIGDWSLQNYPFTAEYRVAFEDAVVELRDYKVTVYPVKGEKFEPELLTHDGYGKEVAYFADVITKGTQNTKNDPKSAAESIRLIEILKKSADNEGEIISL